ncbi:unnamed protein product, partial [Mesorhabditis belari]|uniref:Uncharacterized protein n=1 Tax=Mesorhabditis belari TaxID=2138241 RepID=A0AAF3FMV7_9BILA
MTAHNYEWIPGDPTKLWDTVRTARDGRLAIVLQKCFLDTVTAPTFSGTTIYGTVLLEGKTVIETLRECCTKFSSLTCAPGPPSNSSTFDVCPINGASFHPSNFHECHPTLL